MAWKKKKHRGKHQFRSYYCAGCRQRKPCGSLTRENKAWDNHCCPCYYQEKRESSQAYTNYQQVYKQVARKQQAKIQQLKLLREYAGCVECGSQEVDAWNLYEENRLVCASLAGWKKKVGAAVPLVLKDKAADISSVEELTLTNDWILTTAYQLTLIVRGNG